MGTERRLRIYTDEMVARAKSFGGKIEVYRILRKEYNLSLTEAKELVHISQGAESLWDEEQKIADLLEGCEI